MLQRSMFEDAGSTQAELVQRGPAPAQQTARAVTKWDCVGVLEGNRVAPSRLRAFLAVVSHQYIAQSPHSFT